MGQGFALGTGQGVCRHIAPAGERVPKLERWAARPDATGSVPTLDALKKASPEEAAKFDDLATDTWRAFRRHLDHCGA